MTVQADSDPDTGAGARVVAAARGWLGTPYRHQASRRGVGADCLGLVRGVWRELLGPEPEAPPPYTADWSETGGAERLLGAATRHFASVEADGARPGDIVVMRMGARAVAKHVGVLAASPDGYATIIHAYSGQGVVESPFTPAWRRRAAGFFRFPGRSD